MKCEGGLLGCGCWRRHETGHRLFVGGEFRHLGCVLYSSIACGFVGFVGRNLQKKFSEFASCVREKMGGWVPMGVRGKS